MESNMMPQTMEAPRDRRHDALGDLRILSDDIICYILEMLTPRDVARLACVSSVMYILCNEEPLWMNLCLKEASGLLHYKKSWKETALHIESLPDQSKKGLKIPLHFDGFNSMFLYRRFYRCHTSLAEFALDDGNIERRENIHLEDFYHEYDGKKPVIFTGLAESWPARHKWTTDELLLNYGDVAFRISQRSARKLSMKFRDYVSYMKVQHDEDPLYIFDDKFGEVAPSLLKDYSVPQLFQEDFFDILDRDQRPPYRWLIVGPERSGASWHVDPALTSAWNTLLCGRKRWALYPPGKVPLGVTVHVDEEDGDVNIETPSSLQWWLDFYPLLRDEDKPIECTQLPGETIYVPSGWWHCVLNLETTIAVTQNFANANNFKFVCFDMAPGYRHKGVCRAGFLALDEDNLEDFKHNTFNGKEKFSYLDLTRKEKRIRTLESGDGLNSQLSINSASKFYDLWKEGFSYDINVLSMFLDKERDHYTAPWSSSNSIGPRDLRVWLHRLWIGKPEMRELIWKGACLALNANTWLERLEKICVFHNLSPPTDDERLPVGTGSNPVYLVGRSVIKIFVEGGLEAALYGLGTELEFYQLLHEVSSPLRNYIPDVVACGILYVEDGSYGIVPWDGKGIPSMVSECNLICEKSPIDHCPFGLWGKKRFEYVKAGIPNKDSFSSATHMAIWPYIITKRCQGKIFADLRDRLSYEDTTNLASFLGEQMHHLHLLSLPPLNTYTFFGIEQELDLSDNGCEEAVPYKSNTPAEWQIFISTLNRKRKHVSSHLTKWGDPIPAHLVKKVDDYIPDDFGKLLDMGESSSDNIFKPCSWIHSDIMDDNIYMQPSSVSCGSCKNDKYPGIVENGHDDGGDIKSWHPGHILDFSDLSIGHPLFDLIPIHLDVFRGDPFLLKQFLERYKLPLGRKVSYHESAEGGNKFGRLSYHAMCYCIVHEENVLGAIFSLWNELRTANSWEEVELAVWGELNNYHGFPSNA